MIADGREFGGGTTLGDGGIPVALATKPGDGLENRVLIDEGRVGRIINGRGGNISDKSQRLVSIIDSSSRGEVTITDYALELMDDFYDHYSGTGAFARYSDDGVPRTTLITTRAIVKAMRDGSTYSSVKAFENIISGRLARSYNARFDTALDYLNRTEISEGQATEMLRILQTNMNYYAKRKLKTDKTFRAKYTAVQMKLFSLGVDIGPLLGETLEGMYDHRVDDRIRRARELLVIRDSFTKIESAEMGAFFDRISSFEAKYNRGKEKKALYTKVKKGLVRLGVGIDYFLDEILEGKGDCEANKIRRARELLGRRGPFEEIKPAEMRALSEKVNAFEAKYKRGREEEAMKDPSFLKNEVNSAYQYVHSHSRWYSRLASGILRLGQVGWIAERERQEIKYYVGMILLKGVEEVITAYREGGIENVSKLLGVKPKGRLEKVIGFYLEKSIEEMKESSVSGTVLCQLKAKDIDELGVRDPLIKYTLAKAAEYATSPEEVGQPINSARFRPVIYSRYGQPFYQHEATALFENWKWIIDPCDDIKDLLRARNGARRN